MKVAVCVIVKNENLYIREFIDYYKNLGFANVILYDNNNSIDGEDNPDQIVNNEKILTRIKTYFLLNKVTQEKILMFKEAFPNIKL